MKSIGETLSGFGLESGLRDTSDATDRVFGTFPYIGIFCRTFRNYVTCVTYVTFRLGLL